jgi:ATP-binding cassette subfamily B protein
VSAAIARARRRLVVPQVIQTSFMDCGPACLKSVCEGFGISISYGRLREACQTDVDGTSIDTIEEIGQLLGLATQQTLVPSDHVFLAETEAFPCIAVTRMPDGLLHFVVLWRRVGGFVQVMDPSAGRSWKRTTQVVRDLYVHEMDAPLATWREWAGSEGFLRPLRRQLARLGVRDPAPLTEAATRDPGWRGLATLDAAVRMAGGIVEAGAVARGPAAAALVRALVDETPAAGDVTQGPIPAPHWSARATAPGENGDARVRIRGAVLVKIDGATEKAGAEAELPPELAAALAEPPARPGRELLRQLRAGGALGLGTLVSALAVAATGLVVQGLLFRGLFEIGRELGLVEQRLGAVAALLVFMTILLCFELPIAISSQRIGRHLEGRLRLGFLTKLPRLGVRYFGSRPTSDMAERSHAMHHLRLLAPLGARFLRALCELILTAAALIWLAPASAGITIALVSVSVAVPILLQGPLIERDLRVRTHSASLGRFYLDALLGVMPVRTHGVERAMRREHEGLLTDWARASLSMHRVFVALEGFELTVTLGLAAWLVIDHAGASAEPASVLLLVYWTLTLPMLGQELALVAREYPMHRNVTLRLLEPLGALEEEDAEADCTSDLAATTATTRADRSAAEGQGRRGVAIALEGVTVHASGQTILHDINLTIAPGSHVAVVGASGAGKSSLVGLFLGWHRPAAGRVLVDGAPLGGARLHALRRDTAWVDPAVHLWNRSLLSNLLYARVESGEEPLAQTLETAELRYVIERLPDGMQTALGEGGALVSGGEGQRVRFARALERPRARLAILDEPFRGLDRRHRSLLLERARARFADATVFCITHDIAHTRAFARVLVVADGTIVEDDDPSELARRSGGAYRALLEAEERLHAAWASPVWRRLRVEAGQLVEEARPVS